MAFGVKYSCEWTSPMRAQNRYIIEILEDGYTGEVLPLYPTGDVLTITQGQLDANEFDAIKSSEAVLSLLCVDDGDPYMSLFSTNPLRYMLRVSQRRLNRVVIYWEGYLAAGTYTQNYALPPYRVEVRATDGLALLKDMPYLNASGERYTGVRSLSDMITDIMSRISTRVVTYPYISDNIMPAQDVDTFAIVGIESEGLYSTLGGSDKTPSCYDVLAAILGSMQYQLFQSYGSWCVRPISALLSEVTPKNSLSYVNNGGSAIPLYSDTDDGAGMSTSATLSLLPPYKKIVIDRPQTIEEGTEYPLLLDSSRWQRIWSTVRGSVKQMSKDALRVSVWDSATSVEAYGVAYVFDGVVDKSAATSLSVAFDAYNLSTTKRSFRMGLLLVAEGADPIASWSGGTLDDVTNVALWTNDKWTALGALTEYRDGGHVSRATVVSSMPEVTLEASKRYVMFDIPVSPKQLTMSSIETSSANVSSTIGQRYKLVLVLASRTGLPSMELRNPTLTMESSVAMEATKRIDDTTIAPYGMGEVSFKQTFADMWMLPVSGQTFEAPLIDMRNGATLRGLVSPSQRQQIADVARTALIQLRGDNIRQLDGEVYVNTCVDLGAVWKDRQGRKYYTNYVRRLLRRGLYSVQLRELRTATRPAPTAIFMQDIQGVVGMDTSAMWLSSNGRSLYRYDAQRDSIDLVMSSPSGTYSLTLNAGQCCACVISYDGVYYTLTAYDTHGAVLSEIKKAQNLIHQFDATLVDIVMRAARYDANINVWTLIGGDSSVTHVEHISGEGYNISYQSLTLSSYLNAYAQTLIPNGYAFAVKEKPTDTLYTTFWKSFAQGQLERFGQYQRIVACNEIYLLIENSKSNAYELYRRTDTAMGYEPTPLLSVRAGQYTFVDMNNALAVFRVANGYGGVVYDGRSGHSVALSAPFSLADTVLWLSGDAVYGAWVDLSGYYHVAREVIINGSGVAPTSIIEIE